MDIETKGIILSRQRAIKVLIRLRGCAGLSALLLFAYGINRVFHDVAHYYRCCYFETVSDLVHKDCCGLKLCLSFFGNTKKITGIIFDTCTNVF